MNRTAIIFAVLIVVVGVGADLRKTFVRDAERAVFEETCNYYIARSGPIRRGGPGGPGAFLNFLADACRAAQNSLDSRSPKEQARAALLLSRITLLHETIDRMNAERTIRAAAREAELLNMRGPDGAELSENTRKMMRSVMLTRVTPAGEFLIAHRMGLMIAFQAWLDSGGNFTLASE
jgi:hypothetical protein